MPAMQYACMFGVCFLKCEWHYLFENIFQIEVKECLLLCELLQADWVGEGLWCLQEHGNNGVQNLQLPFSAVLYVTPCVLPVVSYPLQQCQWDLGTSSERCPAG